MIKIVNSTTGEIIERDYTEKELAQLETSLLEAVAKQEKIEQAAEARSAAEAKLIDLGLTAEDLKALLG